MCAYGSPSVRMYLSASCVRISMLPFRCVHARVRDCVYVSPSVCLPVCPRACSCIQMFDRTSLRSSIHSFVCLHALVREGVRLSVRVRPNDCSHMRAFINACTAFLISNFLLLTSMFVLGCLPPYEYVCMSIRPCVCTLVHRVCV